MAHCPACGQAWPGPERIRFLGRTLVTAHGYCLLAPKTAQLLRDIHERRGGLPVAELYGRWPNAKAPDQSAIHWVARINRSLRRLGWQVKRVMHPDTKEAYGLCEILRNEGGHLNCGTAKPTNER